MFQILHCADLHLDASFAPSGLPPVAGSWRRADLRATLGRILSIARERKVDAITIAGDLYEQSFALPDTADFLAQQFAKVAPIRVCIAPGEHDPYTNDSLYALTRWPENVTIFSQGQLSAVNFAPGIYLWGAACPPARGRNALKDVHLERDAINLLLLHASDADGTKSEGETLFTANTAAVQVAGFDFALLGHQHKGRLWPEGTPCCVYPGSPEPLGPEESDGAHHVVLLRVEDGACTPEILPISRWRYHSQAIDLTDCVSTDEAAARVTQALHAAQDGDEERSIYTVALVGTPDFPLDLQALESQVETKAHVRYVTQLSMGYNLEQLAHEQTVRGLLVRRFRAYLSGTTDEQERKKLLSALNIALQALDGK